MRFTKFMIVFYSVLSLLAFWSIFYASSTVLSAVCSAVITALLILRTVGLIYELRS